ncbi:DUF5123 domain-containing protein [uncultured Prevotella sp.]|uniref:DUF5123 domain-containing protein n=1 Tax=uncultured Prevotella sp. TaxID=159272 RepID=UPI00262D52E6|nr:DUF5123 domain-containing protein [uncultured Prevotella sp.]
MKTINKFFSSILIIFLGFSAVSCTDGNDWGLDSAFDRLFGVGEDDITVEATATTATVTFSAMSATKDSLYFVIEVSKDSLYDEIAMGGERAKVFGLNKEIRKSPVVLTGLDGDSKYYMRIKTMSDTKNESKWVYYKDGESFKTLAEQIFDEVLADDYTDSEVTLRWNAPADSVTNILIVQGTDTTNYVLTETDKANQTYTFTDLTPLTTYTFIIYNGEAKRGTQTVTTTAAPPAASYTEYLDADIERFNQAAINEIMAKAQAETGSANVSVTIVFPADRTIDVIGDDTQSDPGALTIPDGMSVNFFGRGGGETPVLRLLKSIDIAGSHNFITFQHLKIVDDGSGANYLINQSKGCTVDKIEFNDCEVSGMKNTFFRLQGSEAKVINNLVIDNCLMHDLGSGYSFIHVDDNGNQAVYVSNIKMTNSTFWNICVTGKTFIYSEKVNMNSIYMEYCTFYNNNGSGQYFIDFNDKTYGPETFSVFNCVFGKTPDEATNKNIRAKIEPEVVNSYCASDFYKSKGFPNIIILDNTSDKLFVDPANADFHFKTGTIEDAGAGDPRWWPAGE